MGLALGIICAWCLAIVVIFMGFEKAGAKRCGGCLNVIKWGWHGDTSDKKGPLFIKGRQVLTF